MTEEKYIEFQRLDGMEEQMNTENEIYLKGAPASLFIR